MKSFTIQSTKISPLKINPLYGIWQIKYDMIGYVANYKIANCYTRSYKLTCNSWQQDHDAQNAFYTNIPFHLQYHNTSYAVLHM